MKNETRNLLLLSYIYNLRSAHLAEVPQLHNLDIVSAEFDDTLLIFYRYKLSYGFAVFTCDDLNSVTGLRNDRLQQVSQNIDNTVLQR